MTDTTLRELCESARNSLASHSYAQAIETGRHVLRYYPQHIETYVLLGEACLERGETREATELFQRALSADPEIVRAWLGLASTCEADELPDSTIWYMERAFELDPTNPAIRQELQSLYGKRHNIQNLRIKLNPAALGRIYLRGSLYHQAISEFASVLKQTPDRLHVKAALAYAYWQVGQRIEAATLCQELLEQMPNCLPAHLILGEIWSRGDQPQEGQEHLRIAEALDPENLRAQELFGAASPLPLRQPTLPAVGEFPEEEEAAPTEPTAEGPTQTEHEALPPAEESTPLIAAVPDWLNAGIATEATEVPGTEPQTADETVSSTAEPVETAVASEVPAETAGLGPLSESEAQQLEDALDTALTALPTTSLEASEVSEVDPMGADTIQGPAAASTTAQSLSTVRLAAEETAPEHTSTEVEQGLAELMGAMAATQVHGAEEPTAESAQTVLGTDAATPPSTADEGIGDWRALADELTPELRALVEQTIAEQAGGGAEAETLTLMTAAPSAATPEQPERLGETPPWQEPVLQQSIQRETHGADLESAVDMLAAAPDSEPSPKEAGAATPSPLTPPPAPIAPTPLPDALVKETISDESIPEWLRALAEQQPGALDTAIVSSVTLEDAKSVQPGEADAVLSTDAATDLGTPVETPPSTEVVTTEPAHEAETAMSASMLEELLTSEMAHVPEVKSEAPPQRSEPAEPLTNVSSEEPTAVVAKPTGLASDTTGHEEPDALALAKAGGITSPFIGQAIERLRIRPDDHEMRLALARAWRDADQIDAATPHYERLIEHDQYVDMVVSDLERLAPAHEQDHTLWALLGDAYMRQGRLSDALSAYRSALGRQSSISGKEQ